MGWWKSLPSPVRIRTNVFMSENFSNDTRNSEMRVVSIFFQEHERSLERSSRPVLSRILSALSYLFPTSGNFDFRPGREGIYGCGLGQIVVVSPIRAWLFYTWLLATVTQHHCRGFVHTQNSSWRKGNPWQNWKIPPLSANVSLLKQSMRYTKRKSLLPNPSP